MTQGPLLHQLAKVELHCHLDGSLSLPVIRQLAKMANIAIPETDDQLKPYVTAPPETEHLMDYLTTFDWIRPLLQTKQALMMAAYDVVEQAAKEHVIYIEIRFAPELSMDKGLSALEVVEAVLDGLNQAMQDYDIIARALVCGLKQTAHTESLPIFKAVKRLAQKGLVGFDFAGNEADYPTGLLKDIIKQTQSLGLPLTFHAGECQCVSNICESLEMGIKRIGHATALAHESEAIDKVKQAEATIELCLSSNLQTKAARSIADFPYAQLYEAGVSITLNTDNRTV